MTDYNLTLSTTEANSVGVVKLRHADTNSQVLKVQVIENGLKKSFKGLTPFFCLMAREVTGQGVSEEPVKVFDSENGTLEYTSSDNALQMIGRNEAYFSFRKQSGDTWIEQFSTRSFHYIVEKSIYSQPFKDSNYWWTFKELYDKFIGYQESGKEAWEDFLNDNKESWEDFVNDNKEIIESVDPGGKLISEFAGARKDVFGDIHETINSRIEVSENLFKDRQTQTSKLSEFFLKLKKKQKGLNIACAGDSLTYGYDVNSTDKREADDVPTDNGTHHVRTRAGKTYPEKLQECLNLVYGNDVAQVRNMGYSGATAQSWYTLWNASKSDLFILMIGTNDTQQKTVEEYMYWVRKIIMREYANGTPVILVSPPKRKFTTDVPIQSYRRALETFAKENNVPFFDLSKNQEAINQDFYSDGTHFNTKGYSYIGVKIFGLLSGETVVEPVKIGTAASLSFRDQLDGFTFISGGSVISAEHIYPTPAELTSDVGTAFRVTKDSKDGGLLWNFETLEDNTVVMPSFYYAGGSPFSLKIELDFGIEQAALQNTLSIEDTFNNNIPRTHFVPASLIAFDESSMNYPRDFIGNTKAEGSRPKTFHHLSGIKSLDDKFLIIAKKGFHTIRIFRDDTSDINVNMFSLDFCNLEVLKARIEASRPKKLNFPVTRFYTDTKDVSSSKITFREIMKYLSISFQGTTYSENSMLKITLYNYDQCALTYYCQVGNLSSPGRGIITTPVVQNFSGYTGTNHRTLSSIEVEVNTSNYFDSTLILNYSGDLKHQTYVTIEQG